jgi:hypothetical protein
MSFEVIKVHPDREHLFGASAAQRDMEIHAQLLEGPMVSNTVVMFDFSKADSISGSYIRATLGWCLNCGRMQTEGQNRSDFTDTWALRPLPVFPVVTGGTREVIWEIHDFLLHRNMACLLVPSLEGIPFGAAEILGDLDEFLLGTLQNVAAVDFATAQSLKEASQEKITPGGWNNRLVALMANRLVYRTKEGKTWNYQALGKEYTKWA